MDSLMSLVFAKFEEQVPMEFGYNYFMDGYHVQPTDTPRSMDKWPGVRHTITAVPVVAPEVGESVSTLPPPNMQEVAEEAAVQEEVVPPAVQPQSLLLMPDEFLTMAQRRAKRDLT
jgi:hypothetical protein